MEMDLTCTSELESLQQENHNLKKQLEREIKIREDLEHEKDQFDKDREELENQFKTLINKKEAEHREYLKKITESHNEEIALINEQYNDLLKKHDGLKTYVASRPASESSVGLTATDELIALLKIEIEQLREKNEELSQSSQTTINHLNEIIIKNKELELNLEETRECLKCKTDSLRALEEALEETKNQNALLDAQLSELKSKPAEDIGRGNSLFSEIEDKRAVLENKLTTLYKKYTDLKRVLASKNSELERAKVETSKIEALLREDTDYLKNLENNVQSTYKRTIKELTERIEELETNPDYKVVTISDKNLASLEWVHTILDQAKAEKNELRRLLDKKTLKLSLEAEKMFRLAYEVSELRKKGVQDTRTIELLKLQIKTLEENNNTTVEQTKPTVVEEQVKKVRFTEA